jgi:hypothetical protein
MKLLDRILWFAETNTLVGILIVFHYLIYLAGSILLPEHQNLTADIFIGAVGLTFLFGFIRLFTDEH